jgi:hypothetical protein
MTGDVNMPKRKTYEQKSRIQDLDLTMGGKKY